MTQVLRVGFVVALMALASASALSDSAAADSLSTARAQPGTARVATLDKADVVARSSEGTVPQAGSASRSSLAGAYTGAPSASGQAGLTEGKAAKWSYVESLTEFIGVEGGSR